MKIVRVFALAACTLGFTASVSAGPSPMAAPGPTQHCVSLCQSRYYNCLSHGGDEDACKENLDDCIASCY